MQYRVLFIALLVAVVAANVCRDGIPIPECGIKRTINGECNNPVYHHYGKTHNLLLRGAEGAKFANASTHEPITTPNVRTVSNQLFRADDSKLQEDGLNLLWTFFGQFVAHDLLGVNRKGDNGVDQNQPIQNQSVWIKVPIEQSNDAFYTVAVPPLNPDIGYIRVLRSRGQMVNGQFEVGSDSTSFLDLDGVYGKEEEVTQRLRKFSGGELKSRVYTNYAAIQGPPGHPGSTTINPTYRGTFNEWLPLVEDVDPNIGPIPVSAQLTPAFTLNVTQRFFATGDGRNGENYWLTTMHGLFMREHNRIARAAKAANPSWNDEKLFQYARNLNIAQYQAILMYEYLPTLLKYDYNEVGTYEGYDPWVNPQSSQLFAFSFRFGHTTVPNTLSLKNKCGNPAFNSVRDGPRAGQMASIFMPADQMAENGSPENVLHAILFQGARQIDFQFPESLRTIGFGANVDVIVQNQMRAAENGVPDYQTVRKIWHGGPYANIYDHPSCKYSNPPSSETSPSPDHINCWKVFTANATAAERLQTLYGKLTNLNYYTSVVGEEPTLSVVGPTHAHVIADQFKRSRDGDRWWFENEDNGLFTRFEARKIKRETKMHTLLQLNFPSANIPENSFFVPKPRFFRNCVV